MHPLPVSLPKECRKAEKIVKSFMEPSRNGLDGVIPRQVLANAKGFCIFTVVKAGFLFSARGGSGIVIAKLPDGGWSAPSAIGTAGMGFGTQAGAEITEFLIVLNSQSALKSFMAAGSLTIGGNLSIAIGPLGRNGEVAGSLNTKGKVAAMYSYSKTKGLFGGISVEGSVILERQDANCIAYGDDQVTAKRLLTGAVPVPSWASGLTDTLDRSTGVFKGWVEEAPRAESSNDYAFNGISSEPRQAKLKNPIKGMMRKSNNNSPRRANPADRYLDAPRNPDEGGIAAQSILDEEVDESSNSHEDRGSDPFYASDPAPGAKAAWSDGLSSEPSWQLENEETSFSPMKKTRTPRFSTHFESDFDFTSPPPATQMPHRASSSISSPGQLGHQLPPGSNANDSISSSRTQNDDDPFGIFSDPPSLAAVPPNLAYNSRQLQQSQPQTQHQTRSPSTPALTSSSTVSAPSSPAFSQSSHHYNPSITSPKPVRQLFIKRSLNTPVEPGVVRAIALYDFAPQEPGDLGFWKGDIIMVTKKSDTADDWWTGRNDGHPCREGMFPANFVELFGVGL